MEAKMWRHADWIEETNPTVIKEKFTQQLKRAGFNVLQVTEHHFQPQGYTALWLLSESHFAVHTFPECGKTYIELSSCNKAFYLAFLQLMND